jgi:hypothetical protein
VLLEHPRERLAHQHVVVHDEDPPAFSRGGHGERGRRGARVEGLRGRQRHLEDTPLPRLAPRADLAPESGDDPVANRESEPGAEADRSGREEGLEDARQHLARHAGVDRPLFGRGDGRSAARDLDAAERLASSRSRISIRARSRSFSSSATEGIPAQ